MCSGLIYLVARVGRDRWFQALLGDTAMRASGMPCRGSPLLSPAAAVAVATSAGLAGDLHDGDDGQARRRRRIVMVTDPSVDDGAQYIHVP